VWKSLSSVMTYLLLMMNGRLAVIAMQSIPAHPERLPKSRKSSYFSSFPRKRESIDSGTSNQKAFRFRGFPLSRE